jgi:putative salt-induced outer membrane protein
MFGSLLLAAALLSQPALQTDEVDTVALEQQVFRAIETKNRRALDGLLASDYVLRGNPDVAREAWLDNAVTLCWGPRWDLQQVVVRESADTRVASFILNFYQDPLTCRPAFLRSLITDIWVREDGQWKLAVRHSGPVGEAGPRAQYGSAPFAPARFEGNAELSFVSTGGNSTTETLGFSAEAVHRTRRSTTTGRTSLVRTATDDSENAQALNARVRYGFRLSDRVEAFSRGGYFRDLFSGVEHRGNADAGFSYIVRQTARRALKFDFGLGGTREERIADADQAVANATLGVSFRLRLNTTAELIGESQGVADVQRGSNWRVTNDVALSTGLNAMLSARLSYSLRYTHRPVPGFRATDRTVSAALVIRYAPRPARP